MEDHLPLVLFLEKNIYPKPQVLRSNTVPWEYGDKWFPTFVISCEVAKRFEYSLRLVAFPD
jgi:hypothetical protein